ncbi:MAG: sulfurtransferase [Phycisphaeraceae bacterium]|nr:sulfurtransferase [Phycisphaeraceae bacterium]
MRMVPCTLVAIALTLMGCSSATKVASGERSKQQSVVIEPEELAQTLASGARPMLLDARKLEDYGPAHALGAQRIDIHEWTDASRDGAGLNDTEAWSIRIGALGIDGNSPVIVYDDGGMTSAARAWFILRECGVRDVRVVNGGWSNLCPVLEPSLVQAGNPGEFEAVRFAAAAPTRVTTRDELKQISAAHSKSIVDVRTANEYTGNIQAQPGREARRTGHVPGATNLPHKQLIDERGRLRSAEELRAMFAASGASDGKPAVLYCQSGGRAAFAALAAEYAGLSETTVYYMSMGEWLGDPSCPISTSN